MTASSTKDVKSAAAEDREREKYFSAEGQCESMQVAKSSQRAFWKFKEGGCHPGRENGERGTARRIGRRSGPKYRRDGVVVRASASQSVDLGSFPKSSHTKRLQKMIFTASLLGAEHKKSNSVQKKPASLLVVSLGKALNGTPPPFCGRQMALPCFTGLQL